MQPKKIRCSACNCRKVIRRGTAEHRFRSLPIGKKKALVDFNVRGRAVTESDGAFVLKESVFPNDGILGYENALLRSQYMYPWEVFDRIST
jgi:hypothetical protein